MTDPIVYFRLNQLQALFNNLIGNSKKIHELPAETPGNKKVAAWNATSGQTEQADYFDTSPLPNTLHTATLTDLGVSSFSEVTPTVVANYVAAQGWPDIETIDLRIEESNVVYDFDITYDYWEDLGITDQESFETNYSLSPVTNFVMEGNRIRCTTNPGTPFTVGETGIADIQAWPDYTDFINLNDYLGETLPPAPPQGDVLNVYNAPNMVALPMISSAIKDLVFSYCPLITEAQMDAAVDQFLTGTLPKGVWSSVGSTPPSAGKQALLMDTNNCTAATF